MNETNKFKIWDWDNNDWLPTPEIGEVLEFNWRVCGKDEGVAWGELKHMPERNLQLIFADNLGNYKDPRGE